MKPLSNHVEPIGIVELKLTEAQMWSAVVNNDASADGRFYYAVRSTMICCSPSCRSRLPSRKNVVFFEKLEDAIAAGFRPCKRCQPDGTSMEAREIAKVTRACAILSNQNEDISIDKLAHTLGISRSHFQRIFKQHAGVPPKAFALNLKAERLRKTLPTAVSITDAIGRAGFEDPKYIYRNAHALFGMKPSRFKKQGTGETIQYALAKFKLGVVLVAATTIGVCWVSIGSNELTLKEEFQAQFANAQIMPKNKTFDQLVADVVSHLDFPHNENSIPLDLRGTLFQQKVWAMLRTIPLGTTKTHSEIAQIIGHPKSARAVGTACASNYLAVLVPCHRVIRADNGTMNYRWGPNLKLDLLQLESDQTL